MANIGFATVDDFLAPTWSASTAAAGLPAANVGLYHRPQFPWRATATTSGEWIQADMGSAVPLEWLYLGACNSTSVTVQMGDDAAMSVGVVTLPLWTIVQDFEGSYKVSMSLGSNTKRYLRATFGAALAGAAGTECGQAVVIGANGLTRWPTGPPDGNPSFPYTRAVVREFAGRPPHRVLTGHRRPRITLTEGGALPDVAAATWFQLFRGASLPVLLDRGLGAASGSEEAYLGQLDIPAGELSLTDPGVLTVPRVVLEGY